MRWRDQIDVMATLVLQLKEFFGKLPRRHVLSLRQVRKLIILAETTLQGAKRKKDRAGAAGAGNRRLFAMVRKDA